MVKQASREVKMSPELRDRLQAIDASPIEVYYVLKGIENARNYERAAELVNDFCGSEFSPEEPLDAYCAPGEYIEG
jgi:hypothetical protein